MDSDGAKIFESDILEIEKGTRKYRRQVKREKDSTSSSAKAIVPKYRLLRTRSAISGPPRRTNAKREKREKKEKKRRARIAAHPVRLVRPVVKHCSHEHVSTNVTESKDSFVVFGEFCEFCEFLEFSIGGARGLHERYERRRKRLQVLVYSSPPCREGLRLVDSCR